MDVYCRLCGHRKDKLRNLLPKKKLLEDINRYLQIQIFVEDFLPHQICFSCECQMRRIAKYARQCQRAQVQFHRILLSERGKKTKIRHVSVPETDRNKWTSDVYKLKVEPDILLDYSSSCEMEDDVVFTSTFPEILSNDENEESNLLDENDVHDEREENPKLLCPGEDILTTESVNESNVESCNSIDECTTDLTTVHAESNADPVDLTNDETLSTNQTTNSTSQSSQSLYELIKPRRDESKTYVFLKKDKTRPWSLAHELKINGDSLRTVPMGDKLYCLSSDGDTQSFGACHSIYTSPSSNLKKPPVLLTKFDLCGLKDYDTIFACNSNRATGSLGVLDKSFTPEEISRRIYAYNCERDQWFPVPSIKGLKIRRSGCLTSNDNLLYLYCGFYPNNSSYFPCQGILRFYDCRMKTWQELIRTEKPHIDSECCIHQGKIYIVDVDCTFMNIFDPVAGKWTTDELNVPPRPDIRLMSYENELLICTGSYIRTYNIDQTLVKAKTTLKIESLSSNYLLDAFVL